MCDGGMNMGLMPQMVPAGAAPAPKFGFPGGPGLVCLTGRVQLLVFIQAPVPGAIIGQLVTFGGGTIPLVQRTPLPFGGVPLAAVDGRVATVCGNLTLVGGQVALDVRFVSPAAFPSVPGKFPFKFPFKGPFKFPFKAPFGRGPFGF